MMSDAREDAQPPQASRSSLDIASNRLPPQFDLVTFLALEEGYRESKRNGLQGGPRRYPGSARFENLRIQTRSPALSPRQNLSVNSLAQPLSSAPSSYVEGYNHNKSYEPSVTSADDESGRPENIPSGPQESCLSAKDASEKGIADDLQKPEEDDFSESSSLGTRHLRIFDVVALIVNKMIGTGIFTTPGMVLVLTDGKGLSLFLWVIGGFYSVLW